MQRRGRCSCSASAVWLRWLILLYLCLAMAVGCSGRRTTPQIDTVSPAPSALVGTAAPAAPLTAIRSVELVGYLGGDQVRTVAVQTDVAYVGFGRELAVLQVSDPSYPTRVGYTVLPELVLDIAVVEDRLYVACGYGGLQVVDLSVPNAPTVQDTLFTTTYVDGVWAAGDRLYVSGDALHVLDISRSGDATEIGVYRSQDPLRPTGKVASVVGDTAFLVYYSAAVKAGGLRMVDVSDATAPVEVGNLALGTWVQAGAIARDHAYLLVGQGMPHLLVIDVSDPVHPVEIGPPTGSLWFGQSVAVVDTNLYLVYPDGEGEAAGLQVLDVTDPAHPTSLGQHAGLASPAPDIAVHNGYAYIATGDGLVVLSVSDPNALEVAGSFRFNTLPGIGEAVTVEGAYAYIAGGEYGMQVVDVSDPSDPVVVSRHDTDGHTWDVTLVDGYAYLADEYNGLRIIDVHDPLKPAEVGAYDVAGPFEFFHDVTVERGYAYIADGSIVNTGMRVIDVSQPARPMEVAFLPLAPSTGHGLPGRVEGVAAADEMVYLAAGTAGLRVVDVSDPTAPAEIGLYDAPGRADNLVVAGRFVYLVDGDLRIIDVTEPTAPVLVGFYDLPTMAETPHVGVQGRYVYLTGQGLRVLDAADPGALVDVTAHPIPGGSMAIVDELVYVVQDGLFILRTIAD